MSTSPIGKCVVCQVPTATRCADCARFGTNWMFFCSREHQKLVFPLHKRVCGVRSSPFRWPGFSNAEIEHLRFMSGQSITTPDGRVTTWLEMSALKGESREETERAFFGDIEAHRDPGKEEALSRQFSSKLLQIRGAAAPVAIFFERQKVLPQSMNQSVARACFRGAFLAQPIDYLLSIMGPLEPDEHTPLWATMVHHKAVVYASVLLASFRDPSPETKSLLRLTRLELVRFCEEQIAQCNPESAHQFLIEFLEKLFSLEE